MHLKKTMVYAGLVVGLGGLCAAADAQAGGNNNPPPDSAIQSAQRTSDLMTNTLFAAVVQEISETTPDNVEEGSTSISLIFDDNPSMRLVGELEPLRDNDYPQDSFEEDALDDALIGQPRTDVQRVQGKWYYRQSIPLSNFAAQCALCHTNFANLPSTEWVGALMLRVPIKSQ